jgi:hypothetical protein
MRRVLLILTSFLLLVLALGCLKTATTQETITQASTTTTIPAIATASGLTQKVESNRFIFYAPKDWKDVTRVRNLPVKNYIAYFDGSGVGFPAVYKNSNLTMNLWLKEGKASDLESTKNDLISSYTAQNPDRVYAAGFKIEPVKIKVSSGQDAYLIHSRFSRKSNLMRESRFELVVFNQNDSRAYLVTLAAQYGTDYDTAEQELNLKQLAEQIFDTFTLKVYTPTTSTTSSATTTTTTILTQQSSLIP